MNNKITAITNIPKDHYYWFNPLTMTAKHSKSTCDVCKKEYRSAYYKKYHK